VQACHLQWLFYIVLKWKQLHPIRNIAYVRVSEKTSLVFVIRSVLSPRHTGHIGHTGQIILYMTHMTPYDLYDLKVVQFNQ
jgi:hypothetical protein